MVLWHKSVVHAMQKFVSMGSVMIVEIKDRDLIGLRMKHIILDAGKVFRCRCMVYRCLMV